MGSRWKFLDQEKLMFLPHLIVALVPLLVSLCSARSLTVSRCYFNHRPGVTWPGVTRGLLEVLRGPGHFGLSIQVAYVVESWFPVVFCSRFWSCVFVTLGLD